MAEQTNNLQLSTETAEALLTAIRDAAPGANGRGTGALRELSEAYSLVRGAMPKQSGRVGTIS